MVQTWAHVAQVGRLPLLTQMMLYSPLLIMIHCTGTGWPSNQLENRALRVWPASPFRIPRQCQPSSLFPVWLPHARHEMSMAQTCSCLQRSLACTAFPCFYPVPRLAAQSKDGQEKSGCALVSAHHGQRAVSQDPPSAPAGARPASSLAAPAGELSKDDSLRCSEGKGPRAARRRDTAAGQGAKTTKGWHQVSRG